MGLGFRFGINGAKGLQSFFVWFRPKIEKMSQEVSDFDHYWKCLKTSVFLWYFLHRGLHLYKQGMFSWDLILLCNRKKNFSAFRSALETKLKRKKLSELETNSPHSPSNSLGLAYFTEDASEKRWIRERRQKGEQSGRLMLDWKAT